MKLTNTRQHLTAGFIYGFFAMILALLVLGFVLLKKPGEKVGTGTVEKRVRCRK
jgi:hypothetical protein